MNKLLDFHSKTNREKHNQDLIDRMKSGENLQRYSSQASWFPPRPVIKKDPGAIETLYGKSSSSHLSSQSPEKK